MKKILVVFACLFAIQAYSQKVVEGSLDPLKTADKAQLLIDFSKAYIHGMSENDFAIYEEDWEKDKLQVVSMFMAEAMKSAYKRLRLGRYEDAPYTIKVCVLNVSIQGSYDCDVEVLDSSGNKVAVIAGLRAKGGHFGSKLNLIKDGAQHTGDALGKYLSKKLK